MSQYRALVTFDHAASADFHPFANGNDIRMLVAEVQAFITCHGSASTTMQ